MPGMLKAHGADSAIIKRNISNKENEFALYQLTNAQEMETLATRNQHRLIYLPRRLQETLD